MASQSDNKVNFDDKYDIELRNRQLLFKSYLSRYVDKGFVPILAKVYGKESEAGFLVKEYAELKNLLVKSEERKTKADIHLPEYNGQNRCVLDIIDYLNAHLAGEVSGAVLHGSLGSGEEVNYSDFDAVVVLDERSLSSVVNIKRVSQKLRRAKKYMYAHDPLQHHGWFILTQLDLGYYSDAYLPHVIYEHACSLFPVEYTLHLAVRDSYAENIDAFRSLNQSLKKKTKNKNIPRNLYSLKLLLSQFMLLPSLYYQAKNNLGVWKAESFSLVEKDFTKRQWTCMNEVSEIRKNWSYFYEKPLRYASSKLGNLKFFKYIVHSLPVPDHIEHSLSKDLIGEIYQLCTLMENKLNEHVSDYSSS